MPPCLEERGLCGASATRSCSWQAQRGAGVGRNRYPLHEPYQSGLHSCREAQKEGELAEKRLQRLEAARVTEVTSLSKELDALRANADAEARERDAKVNGLVEELGNTQALLSEKEAELSAVRMMPPAAVCMVLSCRHLRYSCLKRLRSATRLLPPAPRRSAQPVACQDKHDYFAATYWSSTSLFYLLGHTDMKLHRHFKSN